MNSCASDLSISFDAFALLGVAVVFAMMSNFLCCLIIRHRLDARLENYSPLMSPQCQTPKRARPNPQASKPNRLPLRSHRKPVEARTDSREARSPKPPKPSADSHPTQTPKAYRTSVRILNRTGGSAPCDPQKRECARSSRSSFAKKLRGRYGDPSACYSPWL